MARQERDKRSNEWKEQNENADAGFAEDGVKVEAPDNAGGNADMDVDADNEEQKQEQEEPQQGAGVAVAVKQEVAAPAAEEKEAPAQDASEDAGPGVDGEPAAKKAKVEDGQGQEVMEKTKDLVDIKMST